VCSSVGREVESYGQKNLQHPHIIIIAIRCYMQSLYLRGLYITLARSAEMEWKLK